MVLHTHFNRLNLVPSRSGVFSPVVIMQYPNSTCSLKCFCGKSYKNPIDLEEHRRARGHFPSHRCGTNCKHPGAVPSELKAYKCGDCGKICRNLDMLNDHHIATGHCFCSECDIHFESQNQVKAHRETEVHASEFKCCDCNIFFKDVHALVAHMASRAHRKPLQSTPAKAKIAGTHLAKGHVCSECLHSFQSAQSLQQHRQSVKHKPLSALSCPMGKNCPGNFTSPSALLHHLESGACRSGMNRDEIYRLVQSCDEDGIVHNPPLLPPSIVSSFSADSPSLRSEGWTVSSETQSEWSLLTPSLSEDSMGDSLERWSLLEGSQISFEGSFSSETKSMSKPQCPLCPGKPRKFANSLALEQHMNSPAHGVKIYHCPTNLFSRSCNTKGETKKQQKHFSTLSGLSQHLESGACKGGKESFLYCINLIQDRLTTLGFGGMRLLLPNARG